MSSSYGSPQGWVWPHMVGQRVSIRRPQASDLGELHAALHTQGVLDYFQRSGYPESLRYTECYLNDFQLLQFEQQRSIVPVVCDALTQRRIFGAVGLHYLDWDNNNAEIGLWIRSDAWGKGIGSEACRLMLQFGFSALGLERIQVIVQVGNERSRRLFVGLGAEQEGVLRHRVRRGTTYHDAYCLSFLREGWVGQGETSG